MKKFILAVLICVSYLSAEPFLGEIKMFGGNFAPRGYALCEGQLLPISQYSALFSIVGTMYGGDGRTTFGLPDLRGRVAMGSGNGQGLTPRNEGQKFGSETSTEVSNTSTVQVVSSTQVKKGRNVIGDVNATNQPIVNSNRATNNIQPSQVINYIISLEGLYPSRS